MKQQTMCMLVLAGMALSSPVLAQQFVYPAQGQSPQQQQNDEAACHSWAVQQTGFDPANPPKQAAAPTPATTATGSTPGAGIRGAARGALVGEIVGGDAGAGAAAGAVVARSQSRRQNAAAAQQGQQQQQAAAQQQQAAFAKARAVCLEGRGYSVK
ncbi:glycine zipper family protein [Propionivibrio limicola]|uniref:glycine zipper family protein n=1 Tax=Propionivibrio limicola TaxID=167645 RepID=UPI001292A842|nr:glycine zipper family protein [Propionivibrio limicola]